MENIGYTRSVQIKARGKITEKREQNSIKVEKGIKCILLLGKDMLLGFVVG